MWHVSDYPLVLVGVYYTNVLLVLVGNRIAHKLGMSPQLTEPVGVFYMSPVLAT